MIKSGFIAIIGRPNVGKSTLLNRIIGSKLAIVTAKAQTTRQRVLGILTEKNGQIIFIDTPGIHRAEPRGMNHYMVHEARESLEDPSLIWYMVDPASDIEHELIVLDTIKKSNVPIFLLINKIDLEKKYFGFARITRLEDKIITAANERGINFKHVLKISAQNGSRVGEALDKSWDLLPSGPMYFPDTTQISDRPMRFFVAELILEQLFKQLGEELPYSCAVQIETFNESVKPFRIEASIYTERDSQKAMVIGKNGQKIKQIGIEARKEIEKLVGQQIFLGLKVKVIKDWTKDPQTLKKMGYLVTERKST